MGSVAALDNGPATKTKAVGTPYKFTYRGLQCLGHGFGGAQGSANAGTSYYTTDSTYQPASAPAANLKSLTYGSSVTATSTSPASNVTVSSPTITFANQYQASWCGSGEDERKRTPKVLTPMQTRMNATPTVFTNKTITLKWTCTTAATGSYASTCDPWTVLTILGELVLLPPVPQGVLTVTSLASEGSTIQLGWNVTRG